MEDKFLSYTNSAISRGSISELKVLWKKSIRLGSYGKLIRDSVTSNLDEIAGINGYSQKFASFRELLLHHEDYTSPLRKMCIDNEYILISREQRIPFTPARFFKLLKKTKLRGLRVVFECDGGNIFALEDKISFLLRREGNELTITEFQSEFYDGSFGPYYFIPTRENTGVRITKGTFDAVDQLPMLDILHYFDEEAELTRKLGTTIRIYPKFSQGSVEEVVLNAIEKGENFVVFAGVDKDGEYVFNEDRCMDYLYGSVKDKVFQLFYLRIENKSGVFSIRQYEEYSLHLKEIPKELRRENILLSLIGQVVTSDILSSCPEMEFVDKSVAFPDIQGYCHKVEKGNLCLVAYKELETTITSKDGVDYEPLLVRIIPIGDNDLYVYALYKL